MGFFSDLKEDLSQAVNELMPNEEAEGSVSTEEAVLNDAALSGNMPTSDELSDMLDRMEGLDELSLGEGPDLTVAEPVLTEAEPELDVSEPEPAITEPGYDEEQEPALTEPESVSLAEPEPILEDFATEPVAEESFTEPAAEEPFAEAVSIEPESDASEPAEVNKSIDDNGREERKMEIQAKVATDETAVVTEGMSITGDIVSGGSLELIGSVTGNIEVLGKLNITGTIHGNSKAAEIFAEGARINGEITSQSSVKIGQNSVVIGNIAANSAVIAGAVKGDIDVHGPVVLDTSAIVMGNIKSKSVQINNGAVIEGLCSQCYADVNPTSFFEDIKKKK